MIQVFILRNDIYTPNLMVAAMCSDTNALDKVLRDSLLICSGRPPLKQCYRWSFIVVNDKLARSPSFPPLRPHSCLAQSDRVFWMRLLWRPRRRPLPMWSQRGSALLTSCDDGIRADSLLYLSAEEEKKPSTFPRTTAAAAVAAACNF